MRATLEQLRHHEATTRELIAELYDAIQAKRRELRELERQYREASGDLPGLTEPHKIAAVEGRPASEVKRGV